MSYPSHPTHHRRLSRASSWLTCRLPLTLKTLTLKTLTLTTLTLATATSAPAQGFSPADRVVLEGSASTSYPLGRHNARIQQLHGDLPPTSTQIRGHAYRRDAILLRGTVPEFQVEMEVSLSMSPRDAGSPSRVFAENRGPSPTVVRPATARSIPSSTSRSASTASYSSVSSACSARQCRISCPIRQSATSCRRRRRARRRRSRRPRRPPRLR